jgi:hypothetical protein
MKDGGSSGAWRLRQLGLVSGLYDLSLALPMLLAPRTTAALFGAAAPVPVINAELNGVFTLSLAVGYFWAMRDPLPRRGYYWVAGVLAKLLGSALFVADHFVRDSPRSFLLFAVSDGTLGVLTLAALLSCRRDGRDQYSA